MNNALVSPGQAQRLQRHSPSVPELNLHDQPDLPFLPELNTRLMKGSPSVPELSPRNRKHSALGPTTDPGQNKPLPPLPPKSKPVIENIQRAQPSKMTGWHHVEKTRSFGIALASLNPTKQIPEDLRDKVVGLLLGDNVRILGECQDWAYIRKIDSGNGGIVPKSYLFRPEFEMFTYNSTELCRPKRAENLEELELDEVTDVLKEWHKLLIKYYQNRKSEKFADVRESISKLHVLRTNMNIKKRPKEELKDLQKKFATFIDERNALFKLDVRVRDANGLILDPRRVSIIEYLRKHRLCTTNTFLNTRKGNSTASTSHNSFALLVTITLDSTGCSFDHEIKFYLYDGKEDFQFSESAYFCFDSENKIPRNHKSQILFTDLGPRDRKREKVYLVAAIVRHGPMEFKELDPNKKENKRNTTIGPQVGIKLRRPCGMAVRDISDVFKNEASPVEPLQMTYASFSENDSTLDGTLKKLVMPDRNSREKIPNAAVWDIACEIRTLPGGSDTEKQFVVVRKLEFPEVILPDLRNDLYVTFEKGEFTKGVAKTTDKNVEVTVSIHDNKGLELKQPYIYPGRGPSVQALHKYSSVVYYHEPRPKWNETFVVSLPNKIADFSGAHLRFLFHHRSTREKDSNEKPFALAYLLLQNEEDTLLPDFSYSLKVFKIDPEYYKKNNGKLNYMDIKLSYKHPNAPTTKQTVPGLSFNPKDEFVIRTKLCSLRFTQSVYISKFLKWHSDQLYYGGSSRNSSLGSTQVRPEALDKLKTILSDLRQPENVEDVDYMKFLSYIFNKLFSILTSYSELEERTKSTLPDDIKTKYEACEVEVFDCLLHILGKISDEKYVNFKSLEDYIQNDFSDAAVFRTLFGQINSCLENFEDPKYQSKSTKIMKNIDFLFKIIVASYQNYDKLMRLRHRLHDDELDAEEDFQDSITCFFGHCVKIVTIQNPTLDFKEKGKLEQLQASILNHIPCIIDTLCGSPTSAQALRRELIFLLIDMIQKVPIDGTLAVDQLKLIQDIVDSPLFLDKDCRTSVIPILIKSVHSHLPTAFEDKRRPSSVGNAPIKARKFLGCSEDDPIEGFTTTPQVDNMKDIQTEKCIQLLGNVMNKLHRTDIGPVKDNISHLMQDLLQSTIEAVAAMTTKPISNNSKNHKYIADMVAILLSFFAKMDEQHYTKLCDALKRPESNGSMAKLSCFMENVLMSIKILFSYDHFPSRWSDMILLQNSIIFQALKMFSEIIKVEFNEPFDKTPWLSFFRCATDFITQKSLRLEKFSPQKTASILKTYGDMRIPAAELVLSMWQGLGASKKHVFLHGRDSLILPFLEMTLVPERRIRQSTMSVFYDMLRCEYDHDLSVPKTFQKVENIFMKTLVDLVEAGKADHEYRNIFTQVMTTWCNGDTIGLKEKGLEFVDTVRRFLNLLLQFREVANEENPSNRMTCYVNLLDLSQEIDRKDLYIKYLYKLFDLQKQTGSYTEAAFVLKRHAKQLHWTDDTLPTYLSSKDHPRAATHMELKEMLYELIINYFKKANMYECALEMCDELYLLYREETFNYSQLVVLLREMADFYKAISERGSQLLPRYYRVGFYGKGFPSFLQGKEYIYRNKDSEMLAVFESRILQIYPKAEVLKKLLSLTDELRNSPKQYLLMYEVKPVPAKLTSNRRFSAMKNANPAIQHYYLANEVDVFTYDRPIEYPTKPKVNEFSTSAVERMTCESTSKFPEILSWFPVLKESVVTIRPIELATEGVLKYGDELRKLIFEHHEAALSKSEEYNISSLQQKLNGILDAAVNGGVRKYEEAFLTDDYLEANPFDLHNVEKLKECITGLLPILQTALEIHGKHAGQHIKFHEHFEQCFEKFRNSIEEKYGVNTDELVDEDLTRILQNMDKRFSRSISATEPVRRELPGLRNSSNMSGVKTASSLSFLTMGHLGSSKNIYNPSTNKLNGAKSHTLLRHESDRTASSKLIKQSRRLTGPIILSTNMHQEQNTVHEDYELVTNDPVYRNLVNGISRSNESVRSSQSSFMRQDAVSDDGSGNSNRRSHRWSASSFTGLLGSGANSMNNIASEEEAVTPPPLPPKKDKSFYQYTELAPPKPPL